MEEEIVVRGYWLVENDPAHPEPYIVYRESIAKTLAEAIQKDGGTVVELVRGEKL